MLWAGEGHTEPPRAWAGEGHADLPWERGGPCRATQEWMLAVSLTGDWPHEVKQGRDSVLMMEHASLLGEKWDLGLWECFPLLFKVTFQKINL